MLLAENMYLVEEIEYMEQNLLRIKKEKDKDGKDREDEEQNRLFAKCNKKKYENLII